jgi:ABC-type nitrate/sulfonate/bicarbonate transport system permease component
MTDAENVKEILKFRNIDRSTWLRKYSIVSILLIVWLVVTSFGLVDKLFLPGPIELWDSLMGMLKQLPKAIFTTVSMTLTGFLLGVSFGILSGLAMAYSQVVRDMLGSIFDFIRPVPVFALIPLFVLWFGVGRAPQIALITLGTSVILGVTALEAVRNVPVVYIRASATLGANRRQMYQTIVVPYIIPHLVGATRVAAAVSWGLDVAAEFMGSQVGLGYLMIVQQIYLRTAGIVVICVIYALLAVAMDRILGWVESRLTYWTERRAGRAAVGSMIGI